MHIALKDPIYAKARKLLNENHKVFIWTGWDDPTRDGASEINDIETLRRVFKYCWKMGWPVIRAEV